ncbi:MAG TPA: HAD family hydrolase [Quisquiliibacterium sp.]|nr:HAD family hydrolase [Quisquiliibacterium sp.]
MKPDVPLLAITLDLDDTLWPVKPALIHAEQTLSGWMAEHSPATAAWLTPENRRRIREALLGEHPDRAHDVSFMRRESLRRAMAAAGDDEALAGPAFEVFLEARQRVTLYEDVEPVLARWSRRYRLVAVSNGNADVGRVGLGRYFAASVSAHEVGFGKPDPRIYLEACRRAGARPAEVLHVGDDLHLDVHAARDAGLRSAWVRRPDLLRPATEPAPGQEAPDAFESLQALDAFLHPDAASPR